MTEWVDKDRKYSRDIASPISPSTEGISKEQERRISGSKIFSSCLPMPRFQICCVRQKHGGSCMCLAPWIGKRGCIFPTHDKMASYSWNGTIISIFRNNIRWLGSYELESNYRIIKFLFVTIYHVFKLRKSCPFCFQIISSSKTTRNIYCCKEKFLL